MTAIKDMITYFEGGLALLKQQSTSNNLTYNKWCQYSRYSYNCKTLFCHSRDQCCKTIFELGYYYITFCKIDGQLTLIGFAYFLQPYDGKFVVVPIVLGYICSFVIYPE